MALGQRKKEEVSKILDVNASMQGELVFNDPVNLRINGSFVGKLNTKGNLIIGKKAYVKADIVGEDITIGGKVEGNIVAETRLRLEEGANLKGDIRTPLLVVEEGAIINGHCSMETSLENSSQILDLEEMASFLQVDPQTLLDWAEEGRVPAFKENNIWKFDRKKVEEWLKQEKVYK